MTENKRRMSMIRFDPKVPDMDAMNAEEIAAVEAEVNKNILMAEAATTIVTDPESAKKMGAMALFGEKYGSEVRVVKIGSSSTELCGGTHVQNTGNIGLFKIISETSVAAGVRRIEGTTGLGVLSLLGESEKLIRETARELKTPDVHAIAKKAVALQADVKELRRQLESANGKISEYKSKALLDNVTRVGSFDLLTAKIEATPDEARAICDSFKSKYPQGVVVIAAVKGDKFNFVSAAGSDAVKGGAHAGKILGEISAICGGKGGGRPDSAMSGGRDMDKIDEALARVSGILGEI